MGNENYTQCSLPTEVLFDVLAFVKFHEAPNIFLVNRYLSQICQVYFHSGTVGQNKVRNVRDFIMFLTEGSLAILMEGNWPCKSVPVPEVDPPKIFNAFGEITVEKCSQIQAMKFLNKFSALLTWENNKIKCAPDFFMNNDSANVRRWFWQRGNSNTPSSVVGDEKQFFLNLIEQKKILLDLKFNPSTAGVARCLSDEIARFNGRLTIKFENERNLCGLEEDAKLIYGWISSAGTRDLQIRHYDAKKAKELACQIALLFEQAHVNKKETEKMDLKILLPNNTVVPMHMQKVCNGAGEQLATLRTISTKCNNEIYMAYLFCTKPLENYYENKEVLKLFYRNAVNFV